MLSTHMSYFPSRQNRDGFTVPELLIVIVVFGILSTIGVVGWSTLQIQSQNKVRETELSQWKDTFKLYKSRFAVYPIESSTAVSYCVGNDFPGDRCGANNTILENATLNTNIARVSRLPSNAHTAVVSGSTSYVGPYLSISSTGTYTLVGIFQGGTGECPDGTTGSSPAAGVAYCSITLP